MRADELRRPARFPEPHLYFVEGISDFIYDEEQDLLPSRRTVGSPSLGSRRM